MSDSVGKHTRRAWRELGAGAAWLVVGRVIAALCGLVQVPIALAYLGAEKFGIWIALTGLVWTLSSLDGGLGFALQNRIAVLIARGQEDDASALARHGWHQLWCIAAAITIGGIGLVGWGDWAKWLGVTSPAVARELTPALAAVFAAAALCVPFSLGARAAAAVQHTEWSGLWTAAASVAGLAAIVMARALDLSLAGFTLAACILPVGSQFATWLHVRRRCIWFTAGRAPVGPEAGLWRESAAFFVPQLGAAFIGSFVPTLMALFSGPTAAATYGVLQRLFGLILQLQSLALQPTWPAFTHAAEHGDATGARRIYLGAMAAAAASVAIVLLVVVPFTREIVHLWLGASAPEFSSTLLWAVAGWHMIQCIGQPPAMLLNGTGRAGVVAVTAVLGIAAALALCAWLGSRWGAVGVVAALAAPYVFLNLPLVTWQATRTLKLIGQRETAR